MHGRRCLLCVLAAAAPALARADEPVPTDILLASAAGLPAVSGGPPVPPPQPPPPGERDDDRAPQTRAWGYFARPVAGQSANLWYIRNEFYTPVPFVICDTDLFAATLRFRNLHFRTAAVLPDSGRRFPEDLWDFRLGLNYIHTFDSGWKVGLLPRFGSASDKPFHSLREMTLGSTAFVRFPAARAGDTWTVSLSYFPNSQIAFPVPGVVYEYHPSERLKVGLGLPFSVMWKPADDWRVDLSYVPLSQVTARGSWFPRPGVQVYAGYDWDNEGYFLAGRPDRRELFFLIEQRLVGGARLDLGDRVALDLSAGYAFDRSFGSGRSPLNFRSDRVNVLPGAYLSAWLLVFF